jgi:hypothetical protein
MLLFLPQRLRADLQIQEPLDIEHISAYNASHAQKAR